MIVEFEDWTFDGVPLRSLIDGEPVQESTDLSAGFPDEALLAARRLSGELPGDLPDGRVSLLEDRLNPLDPPRSLVFDRTQYLLTWRG